VDHDAAAHEAGPFSREANAILEYTDELIGAMVRAAPAGSVVALVSDHGFERVDDVLNLPALLASEQVKGELKVHAGFASTPDEKVAAVLRKVSREIPRREADLYAPGIPGFLFEPFQHVEFGNNAAQLHSQPSEIGNHGFWPARAGYRFVFVLWGTGRPPASLGEIRMESIAARLAEVLGLPWP